MDTSLMTGWKAMKTGAKSQVDIENEIQTQRQRLETLEMLNIFASI